MTHHDHLHHHRGSRDWDEDDERGHHGRAGDQRQFGARGSWVQDRGAYGGWASGEGQGEFAGDGYSAQGQFSNQRVAQYRDQGYDQDYGRQGIGWQNRHHIDDHAFGQGTGWEQGPPRAREFSGEPPFGGRRQAPYGRDSGRSGQHFTRSHEGYDEGQSDWQRDAGGGYWGQGASGGQGIGGSGTWRQVQSRDWDAQGQGGRGGTGFSAAGSWMAGPHSGRGPQGYQRSDARIEEDICEHLTHHGMLDATGIQVLVENGEVTLTGTVESRQAKRLAEDILDGISGVRDVHNRLRVHQDQGQTHQNPFMAQAQMDQSDGHGSTGETQGRGQPPRNETKAGATSS
jgi:osmotically-inducible protein OsmY